jgi:hypothetical protein
MLAFAPPNVIAGADDGIRVIGLGLAGRRDEARERLQGMRQASRIPLFLEWIEYLSAWLDRRTADMKTVAPGTQRLKIEDDPEAIFQEGWLLCDVGEYAVGIGYLQRAIAKGYFVAPTLASRPQFDPLRETPEFRMLMEQAEAGRQHALAAFREAGGDRLIGA